MDTYSQELSELSQKQNTCKAAMENIKQQIHENKTLELARFNESCENLKIKIDKIKQNLQEQYLRDYYGACMQSFEEFSQLMQSSEELIQNGLNQIQSFTADPKPPIWKI